MDYSVSIPLKPENEEFLRQTFTGERLEQAGSLYEEEVKVRDCITQCEVLNCVKFTCKDVEAFRVKHEREINFLKTVLKKKDELQRETQRSLNEVKWELEEQKELNRQSKAEIHRLKGGAVASISSLQRKYNDLLDKDKGGDFSDSSWETISDSESQN